MQEYTLGRRTADHQANRPCESPGRREAAALLIKDLTDTFQCLADVSEVVRKIEEATAIIYSGSEHNNQKEAGIKAGFFSFRIKLTALKFSFSKKGFAL